MTDTEVTETSSNELQENEIERVNLLNEDKKCMVIFKNKKKIKKKIFL